LILVANSIPAAQYLHPNGPKGFFTALASTALATTFFLDCSLKGKEQKTASYGDDAGSGTIVFSNPADPIKGDWGHFAGDHSTSEWFQEDFPTEP